MDIYLQFDPSISDDDREDFLKRLRHDFEVLEDGGEVRLVLEIADEDMALSRAQEGLSRGS